MSDRLSEIEARLAAATPGEWYASATVGMTRDEDSREIESLQDSECVPIATFPVEGSQPHMDMDLIAHAPADLAALVEVVREVEALHQPHAVICLNPSHGKDCDAMVCDTCDAPWPCPTAAALQKLGGAS